MKTVKHMTPAERAVGDQVLLKAGWLLTPTDASCELEIPWYFRLWRDGEGGVLAPGVAAYFVTLQRDPVAARCGGEAV